MGIDVDREWHLLWVAQACALEPLPVSAQRTSPEFAIKYSTDSFSCLPVAYR